MPENEAGFSYICHLAVFRWSVNDRAVGFSTYYVGSEALAPSPLSPVQFFNFNFGKIWPNNFWDGNSILRNPGSNGSLKQYLFLINRLPLPNININTDVKSRRHVDPSVEIYPVPRQSFVNQTTVILCISFPWYLNCIFALLISPYSETICSW